MTGTVRGPTSGPAPDPTPQRSASREVAECLAGIEAFLGEFQTLHNALQPLVREYISPPEEQPKA